MRIIGLPTGHEGMDAQSLNLGRWSKITLDSGYTSLSALVLFNTNYIRFMQQGSGLTQKSLGIANLPSGTTGLEMTVDGFISTHN